MTCDDLTWFRRWRRSIDGICANWLPNTRTRSGFSSPTRWDGGEDVPDPYYGGEAGFETMMDLLEAGCAALIDRLSTA